MVVAGFSLARIRRVTFFGGQDPPGSPRKAALRSIRFPDDRDFDYPALASFRSFRQSFNRSCTAAIERHSPLHLRRTSHREPPESQHLSPLPEDRLDHPPSLRVLLSTLLRPQLPRHSLLRWQPLGNSTP